MNGLLELMTTKKWMISPDFVHGIIEMLQANLNKHTDLGEFNKKQPRAFQLKDDAIREYQVTENGNTRGRWAMADMDAPFVNVITIDGPISRSGGACTYGSVEIRDWMMQAADNEFCQAHIFYIDTPGGAVIAQYDFQQAIDYAHAKGQKVIAFVDGFCASMGMNLASMCDEVYCNHGKNQLGSIGVMAAFYTEANGSHNQYTNETYHELYDPESYDKNAWYRESANGNDDVLIEELKQDGIEFREKIQKAFPNAKEEHIHGRLFNAEDVLNIFCDGIQSFGDTIARAFDLANGTATPIARTSGIQRPLNDPADKQGIVKGNGNEGLSHGAGIQQRGSDKDQNGPANATIEEKKNKAAETGEPGTAAASETTDTTPKNKINMEINLAIIAAACGVEQIEANNEGAHFVPDMLTALQATLEKAAQEKADAEALIASLKTQLETAQNEKNDAVTAKEKDLNTAHEEAINNLKAEHQKEIDALKTAHADELKKEQDANADLNQKLKDAQQSLSDATDTIAQLTNKPGGASQKSPENNGQAAEGEQTMGGMPDYDHSKSPLENARIRKEWLKKAQQS